MFRERLQSREDDFVAREGAIKRQIAVFETIGEPLRRLPSPNEWNAPRRIRSWYRRI